MFGSRTICLGCNTPQSPEAFAEGSDLCSACADKHTEQMAMIQSQQSDGDRFAAKLKELRKKDPAIPGLADAVLDELGGVESQAARLASDFKSIRGEDLTAEQRELHTISHGPLVKMHGMIMELLHRRDTMVGDADSMGDMDEDDLNAIVSQSAMIRLETDPHFRLMLFQEILNQEPNITDRLVEHMPALGAV